MRDPFEGLFLGGLYYRRHLNLRLQEELARGKRSGAAVALLLLDLDHFKDINDTLGHVAGDDAHREVTTCVQSLCRRSDLLFRYGGYEFIVVCPGANEHEAPGAHARVPYDVPMPICARGIAAGLRSYGSRCALPAAPSRRWSAR